VACDGAIEAGATDATVASMVGVGGKRRPEGLEEFTEEGGLQSEASPSSS
jgi:hypothetical protein